MTGFSVEKEISSLDLPMWLEEQKLFPKLYLKCRRTNVETAVLGSYQEFDSIPTDLEEKVYGMIPFPSSGKDPLWKDFKTPFFFLPQVEIVQSPEKTVLKIRGSIPQFYSAHTSDRVSLEKIEDLPNFDLWEKSVHTILDDIRCNRLQKAVLARRSCFKIEGSSFSCLQGLVDNAFHSTVFAFQKSPSSLFLGATPEILYERNGRTLRTESIAGTRKRGSSDLEDFHISELLKQSAKDTQEIAYVKKFLEESLSSLCESFFGDPSYSTVKTSHLLHLYHSLEGTLKESMADVNVLSQLHPTPAVGAFPKSALEKALSLEPFDRGLYAGVIGSFCKNDAFFAVAIRSALIQEGFLYAFAGVGIVEGSDPKQEWNELDHKISHWSSLCPLPL